MKLGITNSIDKSRVLGTKRQIHKLTCRTCHLVALSPIVCAKCGELYCNKCIKLLINSNNLCKNCSVVLKEGQPSASILDYLKSIKTKCIYFKQGCTVISPISNTENHELNCEYKFKKSTQENAEFFSTKKKNETEDLNNLSALKINYHSNHSSESIYERNESQKKIANNTCEKCGELNLIDDSNNDSLKYFQKFNVQIYKEIDIINASFSSILKSFEQISIQVPKFDVQKKVENKMSNHFQELQIIEKWETKISKLNLELNKIRQKLKYPVNEDNNFNSNQIDVNTHIKNLNMESIVTQSIRQPVLKEEQKIIHESNIKEDKFKEENKYPFTITQEQVYQHDTVILENKIPIKNVNEVQIKESKIVDQQTSCKIVPDNSKNVKAEMSNIQVEKLQDMNSIKIDNSSISESSQKDEEINAKKIEEKKILDNDDSQEKNNSIINNSNINGSNSLENQKVQQKSINSKNSFIPKSNIPEKIEDYKMPINIKHQEKVDSDPNAPIYKKVEEKKLISIQNNQNQDINEDKTIKIDYSNRIPNDNIKIINQSNDNEKEINEENKKKQVQLSKDLNSESISSSKNNQSNMESINIKSQGNSNIEKDNKLQDKSSNKSESKNYCEESKEEKFGLKNSINLIDKPHIETKKNLQDNQNGFKEKEISKAFERTKNEKTNQNKEESQINENINSNEMNNEEIKKTNKKSSFNLLQNENNINKNIKEKNRYNDKGFDLKKDNTVALKINIKKEEKKTQISAVKQKDKESPRDEYSESFENESSRNSPEKKSQLQTESRDIEKSISSSEMLESRKKDDSTKELKEINESIKLKNPDEYEYWGDCGHLKTREGTVICENCLNPGCIQCLNECKSCHKHLCISCAGIGCPHEVTKMENTKKLENKMNKDTCVKCNENVVPKEGIPCKICKNIECYNCAVNCVASSNSFSSVFKEGIKSTSLWTLKNAKCETGEIEILTTLHSLTNSPIRIDFSNDGITENGINKLDKLLEGSSTIYSINLSRCNINEKSIENITESLKQNKYKCLSHLNLSDNMISGECCRRICSALKENSILHELIMNNTNLVSEDAYFISSMLKANKSIKKIELNNNKFGDSGCVYLNDAIKSNQSLTYIELQDNNISEENKKELKIVCSKSKFCPELTI